MRNLDQLLSLRVIVQVKKTVLLILNCYLETFFVN